MEASPSACSPPSSIITPDSSQSSVTDWSCSTQPSPSPAHGLLYRHDDVRVSSRPHIAPRFTPTFVTKTTSDLHFTAFPPHDLKRSTSSILGWQSAVQILHKHYKQDNFRRLIGRPCTFQRISSIPASSLPSDIFDTEKVPDDEFEFYAIDAPPALPAFVSSLSPKHTWYLAVRQLPSGLEKLILGPLGVTIHTLCSVQERSPEAAQSENAARQRIYLTETTKVRCWSGLQWWAEKTVGKDVREMHESFRIKWDESVLATWEAMRRRRGDDESLLD